MKEEMTYEDWYNNKKNNQYTDDIHILMLSDGFTTVAQDQIKTGWTTDKPSILKRKIKCGKTLAHLQTQYDWTTEDVKLLSLTDSFGYTVAHYQAYLGWTTENTKLLRKGEGTKNLAEIQSKRGWHTNDTKTLLTTIAVNYKSNLTIAEIQIKYKKFTENETVLKNVINNKTVALLQMEAGWIVPNHLLTIQLNESTTIKDIWKRFRKKYI